MPAIVMRFGYGLARDVRGTITIIAAFALAIATVLAGFAVDFGSMFVEHRRTQSAVDLAAIAAATDIPEADHAARATIRANGIFDTSSIDVALGHYQANPQILTSERFIAGQQPFNAAQVTVERPRSFYFAKIFSPFKGKLRVTGVAATASAATFSVGSRLTALRGGVANKLLEALLGSSVSLSAVDYDALASADVTTSGVLNALASDLGITAGTYSQLLGAEIKSGQLLAALSHALRQTGDIAGSNAFETLSQSANKLQKFPLSAVIDLGPYANASIGNAGAALNTALSALDLAHAGLMLANGDNQVALDLGASVPGLLSLKVDLAIGERPQQSTLVAVGQPGATVKTAQVRLRITAEVGGTGVLAGVRVRVPIIVEAARAEARLDSVTCGSQGDAGTAISVRPGIAKAWLGDLSTNLADFSQTARIVPARIVDAGIARISASAAVEVANTHEETLSFDQSDVAAGTIKRVDTRTIAGSLVASLVSSTTLDIKVLGLGVGLPGLLNQAVTTILSQAAAPLDGVIAALLDTLGLRLGEADVRVHAISCRSAVLAG